MSGDSTIDKNFTVGSLAGMLEHTAHSFIGTRQNTTRSGKFTLSRWSVRICREEREYHGHADAHFMYVPSFCGYVTEARGEQALNLSNLVFNPAQTYHCDRLTTPGWFFSISLPPTALDNAEPPRLPKMPTQIAKAEAHTAVAHLIKLCGQEGGDAGLSAEAICFELIAWCCGMETSERARPQWLDAAIQYMHDNLRKEISVMEMSKRVGVHPVHLARVFRAFYGCSPGGYLRTLRLRRAQTLLSRTKLTLFEVAHSTGFADQSHFTKQFSCAFGIPPGEYRRLTSIYRVRSVAAASPVPPPDESDR